MASTNFEDLIGRGTTGNKPAAGSPGRLYYDTDLDKLQRDNGATWDDVERGDSGGSGDSTLTDVLASIPSPSNDGNLFFPSNGLHIYRDTGAAWAPWGPLYPMTLPVPVSSWTWVNQGTATADETNGGIYLLAAANASDDLKLLVKAIPSVPYTITAWIIPHMYPVSNAVVGLVFRQSSDGKLSTLHILGNTAAKVPIISSTKWTNPTTFNADYLSPYVYINHPSMICLRIVDDNANRVCSWSLDGYHFHTIHTVGRTDFLTADQVGFVVGSGNATYKVGMTLLSWVES